MKTRTLKKYLFINSLFSLLSGLLMILYPDSLNDFFGINHQYVFPIIGANLLFFSLFVGYVATQQLQNQLLVNLISILDAMWVIGSLAIVGLGLLGISTNGNIAIGVVGVWIAFLGYQQYRYNQV